MSADVFLDTNVLVYAFDKNTPAKRAIARELLTGKTHWAISWQVVQEFCAVALHRFAIPFQPEELQEVLDLILLPHCRVLPTLEIYRQALRFQAQTQYRFYDSLIVASALVSGARTLYSEDLQHGRKLGTMTILNPFIGK